MKFVKSLLLGSAAGLVAVSGAQAADLPAKAKAVEYVKVCDAYGAGFYFIPGTDICLRVGGYVRVDYYAAYHGANSATFAGQGNLNRGPLGVGNAANVSYDRADHLTTMRARAALDLDARTRTEYGTLRSYSRFYVTTDTVATGSPTLERAFIQFAGFTFGYTQSFFDYSTGLGTYATAHVGSNRWTTVFAYTAQLGNGVSATIAAEDRTFRDGGIHSVTPGANAITGQAIAFPGVAFNAPFNHTDGLNDLGGHAMPDIVANIRVDQSWGSAQLSGAIHQLRSNSPNFAAPATLDYDTEYGFAIGGGLTFNLDMIAKGDQFVIQGSYADGAVEYTGVSANVGGSRGLVGLVRGTTGAIVDIADGYVDFAGNIQTVEAWTIRADFRHFWTPTLRSTIWGGYTDIDVPVVCSNAACTATGTASAFNPNSPSRDFSIWQVGLTTVWSPVRNLDIGLEVLYSKIDVGGPISGAAVAQTTAPAVGGVPVRGAATFDEDIFSGMVRVQRNF